MRFLGAALVGAVIYYIWQMLTWLVLPIHGPTIAEIPNENALREFISSQNLETGVYVSPYADDEAMADPESEFSKNHKSGPIFSLYFQKEGAEPMPPSLMAKGFANDFLAALIVALMLGCATGCCNGYFNRVLFVSGFGVFLALTGHVSYLIWMRFPLDYSLMFMVDVIVGWFLAGLGIAAIIRPRRNDKLEQIAA